MSQEQKLPHRLATLSIATVILSLLSFGIVLALIFIPSISWTAFVFFLVTLPLVSLAGLLCGIWFFYEMFKWTYAPKKKANPASGQDERWW